MAPLTLNSYTLNQNRLLARGAPVGELGTWNWLLVAGNWLLAVGLVILSEAKNPLQTTEGIPRLSLGREPWNDTGMEKTTLQANSLNA